MLERKNKILKSIEINVMDMENSVVIINNIFLLEHLELSDNIKKNKINIFDSIDNFVSELNLGVVIGKSL